MLSSSDISSSTLAMIGDAEGNGEGDRDIVANDFESAGPGTNLDTAGDLLTDRCDLGDFGKETVFNPSTISFNVFMILGKPINSVIGVSMTSEWVVGGQSEVSNTLCGVHVRAPSQNINTVFTYTEGKYYVLIVLSIKSHKRSIMF